MNFTPADFVISDTHFGHANIIKYCDRPKDHDALMIRRWHQTVRPGDRILHLGDIIFYRKCSTDLVQAVRDLPGEKYFLRGNHDHHAARWYQDELGFTEVLQDGKAGLWYLNLVGTAQSPGKRVLFSHYPQKDGVWNLNVHGHTHDRDFELRPNNRIYRNVCVERMDYRPVKIQDVLAGTACSPADKPPIIEGLDWTPEATRG